MTSKRVSRLCGLAVLGAALTAAAETPCWPVADTGNCGDPVAAAYGPVHEAFTTPAPGCWPVADHLDCAPVGAGAGGSGGGQTVAPAQAEATIDEVTWRRRASD
jgi:hypothetical protein